MLQKDINVHLFADYISPQLKASRTNSASSNGKTQKPSVCPSLELYAILYGSDEFFEPVGIFAARCKMYLQHPRHCEWNVPYRNPHCLSPEDGRIVYTFDLANTLQESTTGFEISSNPIDLFADATIQDMLIDAETPQALSTKLYRHQKQALTFMAQRELGWAMDGHHKDIWKEEKDAVGRLSYHNIISGLKQKRPPDQFKGGLLIDAPGLGKSLSILALMAYSVEIEPSSSEQAFSSTTLLIVPKTRKRRGPSH